MNKNKFFLDSPNLTDLIQVLINNICSEKIFNVNKDLVLKKYDQSIKKINFILVDGLGSKNIENLDNLFTNNQTDEIVSTFPSSTSVALSSINFASKPIDNGLIGYFHFAKQENKLINTLNWKGSENYLKNNDFFSSQKSIWNILNQKKINFNVIQPKNLIGSPLSDHIYMGANQIGYENLNQLESILSSPQILDNQFNYIYYPVIDVAAHIYGTNSDEWQNEVNIFSDFLSRMTKIDSNRYTCITADHGVVNIEDSNKFRLKYDESMKIYGDQRAVYINGDFEKIKNVFKNVPGYFLNSEEIISLLGSPDNKNVKNFFPEQIFLLQEGNIIFPNHLSANLKGYHGGLSKTEVYIPLIEIVN